MKRLHRELPPHRHSQWILGFLQAPFSLVFHHHLVEHLLKVSQLKLDKRLLVFIVDKLTELVYILNIYIIDDDTLHLVGQVRQSLMDKVHHLALVEHSLASIKEIRQINRHHAILAARDAASPILAVQACSSIQARYQARL